MEAQALCDMQLMPGVLELSAYLDALGVPRALVTRNVNGRPAQLGGESAGWERCSLQATRGALGARQSGRVHASVTGRWRRPTLARSCGFRSLLLPRAAVPAGLLSTEPCSSATRGPPPFAASIEFFHKHHFTLPAFTPALSREFAPYKVCHLSPALTCRAAPAAAPRQLPRLCSPRYHLGSAMPTPPPPAPPFSAPRLQPNPASLLHIAEKWGVAPSELVMVGDSAKDDVSAGPCVGRPALPQCRSKWHQGSATGAEHGPRVACCVLGITSESRVWAGTGLCTFSAGQGPPGWAAERPCRQLL